ncbi:MAG: hypothetical protein ABMB14_36215 [Myxococcota bacterium]
MVRSKLVALAALLAILTGCAYKQAMHKGDKLAAAGDWVGAYASYAAAVEKKPDEPEAETAKGVARDHVVDDALVTAEAATGAKDYEKAMEELARAETYDHDRPEVFKARRACEDAIRQDLIALWEGGDARGTYALAIRTQKLFPKAEFLPPTLDQLRGHFADRAEELLGDKKFDVSLAAIRTIVEFEPDRTASVAPIEQKILTAWADDLVAKGVQHAKAKRLGAASASYARAYELAGRHGDLEKAQAIAQDLGTRSRLTTKLDLTGPPSRVAAIKTVVVGGLQKVPESDLLSVPPVTMAIRLTVAPQKCVETDAVTKATQDYVSGQIEKPNPQYAVVAAELAKAKVEAKAATAQVKALEPQVAAADANVKRFDLDLQAAEKRHTEAQSAYDLAKQQLDGAKQKQDVTETQLEAAKAAGLAEAATLESELGELAKRVAEWSGVVIQREGVETAARKDLDGIAANRTPAVDAYNRLKAGFDAAVTEQNTATALLTELTSKLAVTPKTVMEDVHETLKYDVHDWTRSCTAPVSAAVTAKWPTKLATTRSFAPKNATTDRSHIGFAKAALVLDEKKFPQGDTELVAAGDAVTAGAVVEWASTLADDYYRRKIDDAVAALSASPVDAATPAISLFVGARSRLDADTLALFQRHLKEQFGLERIDLLVATSAP